VWGYNSRAFLGIIAQMGNIRAGEWPVGGGVSHSDPLDALEYKHDALPPVSFGRRRVRLVVATEPGICSKFPHLTYWAGANL
jgi:hypothetical protein